MSANVMKNMCTDEAGKELVLQGNIAFAVGCVRSGIHSADGYPGTPSTEVIDRGLSQVQDMINVGWSVNEAVAAGVGFGYTLAGADVVVCGAGYSGRLGLYGTCCLCDGSRHAFYRITR